MTYSYEELTGGLGRAVAFRAQRYLIRDLLPRQKATLLIRRKEYSLYDVSMNGVSFVAPSKEESWQIGAKLRINVVVHGESIYKGWAKVVRIDRSALDRRIGLRLLTDFLDLLELRQKDEEKSLEAALSSGPSMLTSKMPRAYRQIAEQITHFINFYKRRLDHHEERYSEVNEEIEDARRHLAMRAADKIREEWLSLRTQAAKAALPSLANRETMRAVKEYTEDMISSGLLTAPIIHRSYTKPLGYPGDYQVMNQVYRNHFEGPSAFAQVFHKFVCEEPLAAGVRTRKDLVKKLQLEQHRALHARNPSMDVLRVTSLACGPAREVVELTAAPEELPTPVHWTLIDQEERALSLAYHEVYRSIASHRAPCTLRCMYMSFGQLLRDPFSALGEEPQDFIYAAGLFDYLGDLPARALIKTLYENLAPGGLLAIGNACAPTLNFWIPEFVLDWSLIYRTEEQLVSLTKKISKPGKVEVHIEPSAAYYFLVIRKG